MSSVDWNVENCKANTKAVLGGISNNLPGFVAKVASLKLDQNISCITFSFTIGHCCDDYMKKGIAEFADLLKSNPNIKTLLLYSTSSNDRRAREYLLQALADGIAGDSLEYLWLDDRQSGEISAEETAFLVRYLNRNRNLSQLRFDVIGAPGLHLVSCLPTSVRNLCLDVWQYRGMVELGAMLKHCSSLFSLNIIVYSGNYSAEVESFFRSIGQLRSLTHLEVEVNSEVSAEVIDALHHFVVHQGTLAHFAIDTHDVVSHGESWQALGLALCSVKSVELRMPTQDALLAVLPQLQSCESLHFLPLLGKEIRPILEIICRLPNLRDLAVDGFHSIGIEHAILDMIKSSKSIHTVHFKETMPTAFQGSLESFGVLNRVFDTTLVSFGPTDLWTRVLSKMSDESARATLLYRLLREKPEMIMGSLMQSDSMQ